MSKRVTFFLQESWLLMLASLCFGLVLALAQGALSPRIEANRIAKLNALCRDLITDANGFDLVVEGAEIPTPKRTLRTDIYRGSDAQGQVVGYAFTAVGAGFAGPIHLVIAADETLSAILGYRVLASNETPGFGDKIKQAYYRDQFAGIPYGPLELVKVGDAAQRDKEIVAITGATVSSEAVLNIFNTFLDGVKTTLIEEGQNHGN